MKRRFLILSILFLLPAIFLFGWGFWAHKKINKVACFTLPPEMIEFYKLNIDFIEKHSVDPDQRRNVIPEEAPRHYIDIDHYGMNPFDSVPQHWNDAVLKYSEDTLVAYGIVPWYVNQMLYRLTDAFATRNRDLILYYSANIGHYIADAHVPLHCTENYNGQLTNQHGIHGFWESRLPELFGDEYDYFAGRAEYIAKPQQKIWEIIKSSFSSLDSVLLLERKLSNSFPSDQKYAYEQRGSSSATKVYSREYSAAYHEALQGMVERQMRNAILNVGSFWYTAWVNAGSPDLSKFPSKEVSDSLKLVIQKEEMEWKAGKLKGSQGHENLEETK